MGKGDVAFDGNTSELFLDWIIVYGPLRLGATEESCCQADQKKSVTSVGW